MSDDKTIYHGSFEDKVLSRLEDFSVRLAALEQRAAAIEETKSVVERLLRDFTTHNIDVKSLLSKLDRKVNIVNTELFQLKTTAGEIEERVDKVESASRPQMITQEHQF